MNFSIGILSTDADEEACKQPDRVVGTFQPAWNNFEQIKNQKVIGCTSLKTQALAEMIIGYEVVKKYFQYKEHSTKTQVSD